MGSGACIMPLMAARQPPRGKESVRSSCPAFAPAWLILQGSFFQIRLRPGGTIGLEPVGKSAAGGRNHRIIKQTDCAPAGAREMFGMPSTYLSLHYHLVFSTKNREPSLDVACRARIHEYLGAFSGA